MGHMDMVRERNAKPESNGFHQSNGVCDTNQNDIAKTANGTIKAFDDGKLQLYHRKILPRYLGDNDYLMHYHRPEIPSITGCVKSAFYLHTETINIWTHFIGSIGTFIIMILYYKNSNVPFEESRWHLPFFLGAITCMGVSAVYHTFLCYSEHVHNCLAKFDYCGIIVLIVSSFPPWCHLGFYCEKHLRNFYLVLIYGFGTICIFGILMDGLGNKNKHFRTIRAALFMTMGLFGLFPGLHFFYLMGFEMSFNYGSWLLIMAAWYLTGGVIYALRVPEKLAPGVYDIVMHSHQFLHLFVIMGVISCYIGITKLAEYRRHTNYYCPENLI